MAELVDALDSKSGIFGCESSSLSLPTTFIRKKMKYFAIVEAAGYYDDYQETPLFLVETKEKAEEYINLYNKFVKWKNKNLELANETLSKWEQENPPPVKSIDYRRIDRLNQLLQENFKEELKKPLREELTKLKKQEEKIDEWYKQRQKIFTNYLEASTTPSEFNSCTHEPITNSKFFYIELEVKNE